MSVTEKLDMSDDRVTQVKSLLIGRGAPGWGGQYLLERLANELRLSDEDLAELRALALADKAAAVKRKAERENPMLDPKHAVKLDDAGASVSGPIGARDFILRYACRGKCSRLITVEQILGDAKRPLPLPCRLHRHPDDSPEEFKTLVGIVSDLRAGKLTPGRTAYLVRGPAVGALFPTVSCTDPYISYEKFGDWSFIPGPGVDAEEFDERLKEFNKQKSKWEAANNMTPPRRRSGVPAVSH